MPSALTWRLQAAVRVLQAGGVIACPTEAVWGLSCDPWQEDAVMRLLHLKQRSPDKGLILVAASVDQFDWLLQDLEPAQRRQLESSWPGPYTWLVPHRNRVPRWIHGNFDTVALRVSAHPVMAALCHAWGGSLVSTSANRAGCLAPRERFQVVRYFGGELDDLLPGAVGRARRPSEIRDLASGELIRA